MGVKTTKTTKETQKLAETLAKEILSLEDQPGACVVALVGDLGAGKTSFVQGFAKALGIKEKITSPTFTIVKKFEIRNSKFETLIHMDIYRIDNFKELKGLDWDGIVSNAKNVVLIEWAEKIEKILPRPYFLVNFEHSQTIYGEHSRTIDITLVK